MTPEERAEKIWTELTDRAGSGLDSWEPEIRSEVKHVIAAEIREAVDDDRCQRSAGDLYKHNYNRGKAEAYENAAMILDTAGDYGEKTNDVLRRFAEGIRARAKEVGK